MGHDRLDRGSLRKNYRQTTFNKKVKEFFIHNLLIQGLAVLAVMAALIIKVAQVQATLKKAQTPLSSWGVTLEFKKTPF